MYLVKIEAGSGSQPFGFEVQEVLFKMGTL